MNEIFLIMGCPRSGTSITSAVCQKLGLFVGSEFQAPNEFNPIGFFADMPFNMLLQQFIQYDAETGIPSARPLKDVPDHVKTYFPDFIELHEKIYCRGRDWGFKNNYTSYIIDTFIDSCNQKVNAIGTNRPKDQSAKSLGRLVRRDPEWCMQQVVSHHESQAKAKETVLANGGRWFDIEFEELIADPKRITKSLADFLFMPYSEEAAALVQSKYKRF